MGQAIRSGGGKKSHNLKEQWKMTKWKIEFTDDEIVLYNKKQQNLVIASGYSFER